MESSFDPRPYQVRVFTSSSPPSHHRGDALKDIMPLAPEPKPLTDEERLAGCPTTMPRVRAAALPVLNRHNVTWKQIVGNSRKVAICTARHEMAAVLHQILKSTTVTGKVLGGRDHTTIVHSIQRWRDICDYQRSVKGESADPWFVQGSCGRDASSEAHDDNLREDEADEHAA